MANWALAVKGEQILKLEQYFFQRTSGLELFQAGKGFWKDGAVAP